MEAQRNPPAEAVAYVRVSEDREGAGLGVARQRTDCEALAGRLEWTVADVYVDNDTSAYAGTPRPGYRRLVADIRAGAVTRVLCWHTDRLHRLPAELEDYIDAAERAGAVTHAVKAGPVDLSTPSGRAYARTMCAWARFESEHRGERLEAKFAELARDGKPHGGPRPYGYAGDGKTVVEAEAEVIRWAYRRVLAGESINQLVAELDRAGTPTAQGYRWSRVALRRTLTRPRYAGLRQHRGKVVGEAAWPAVVDRGAWEQVVAILDARADPTHVTAPKYLLTGKCYCVCSARMKSNPTADGRATMVCSPAPPWRGCGRYRVSLDPLTEMVEGYVTAKLADRRVLAELTRAEYAADARAAELTRAIADDERRLEALTEALTDGDTSEIPAAAAAARKVSDRIAAARAARDRRAGPDSVADIDPDTIADEWPGFTRHRRRQLTDVFVDRIVVGPAPRCGFVRFDPERVDIVPTGAG